MELCIKCFFDNKQDFERIKEYLEGIGHNQLCVSGRDVELDPWGYYIEDYSTLTQDQLNKLTALCPIKPNRKVSREAVYNRIAYLIGIFGASYHPDDDVRDLAPEGSDYTYLAHLETTQSDIEYMCDKLGLDPCAIALEILTDLGINPLEK